MSSSQAQAYGADQTAVAGPSKRSRQHVGSSQLSSGSSSSAKRPPKKRKTQHETENERHRLASRPTNGNAQQQPQNTVPASRKSVSAEQNKRKEMKQCRTDYGEIKSKANEGVGVKKIHRRLPPVVSLPPGVSISSRLPAQANAKGPKRAIMKSSLNSSTKDGLSQKGQMKIGAVFVSRKQALGGLIRRCKEMLIDLGYNQLVVHALCPAIPQALLLLTALLEVLPYPSSFVTYEIKTGSVACVDEVTIQKPTNGSVKSSFDHGKHGDGGETAADDEISLKIPDLYDEEEGGYRTRLKITLTIGSTSQQMSNSAKSYKTANGDRAEMGRTITTKLKRSGKAQRARLKKCMTLDIQDQSEGPSSKPAEVDAADIPNFDEEEMMNGGF